MDRADRVPLRQGPHSVALVTAEDGSGGLRGELLVGTAIAAGAAVLVAVPVSVVVLLIGGHLSVPLVLAVSAVAFLVTAAVLAWQVLFGTRRIEFRPAAAPAAFHVISSLRADRHPVDRLRLIALRHRVVQSDVYPFTLRTSGGVAMRLELDGAVVKASLPSTVDVPALAEGLRALLEPARVPVDVDTTYPSLYDPEVEADVLPAGGVVLEIMARRVRGRRVPRPGYLFGEEVQQVWRGVRDGLTVAEANGVRTRRHTSSDIAGRDNSWVEFRAVDVQRVADEIAGGTATLYRPDGTVGG